MTTPPTFNLADDDYRWVTYQPRAPRPLPKVKPTTFEALAQRLHKLKYYAFTWYSDWSAARIAPALDLHEALFWFWAMTEPFDNAGYGKQLIQTALNAIQQRSLTTPLTLADINAQFATSWRLLAPEIVLPLRNLLSFPELVQALLTIPATPPPGSSQSRHHHHGRHTNLAQGFRLYALPYATAQDLAAAQPIVRAALADFDYASDTAPLAVYLAARLGLTPELEKALQKWHFLDLMLGLPSAAAVMAAVQATQIHLSQPHEASAWLAHTGLAGLPLLRASIKAHNLERSKERIDDLVRVLGLAVAPEVAPHMLALHTQHYAPRRTREWLDTHPAETIAGLLPLLVEGGELAEPAALFVRKFYRQMELRPQVEAALAALPPAQAEAASAVLRAGAAVYPTLDAASAPAWLQQHQPAANALAKLRKAGWADPTLLPPLVVGDHQLNDDQVRGVLMALQTYRPQTERGLFLTALKTHVKPEYLDAFAWRLYELWLADGADAKDRWALTALGALGGDAVALKLAPLVRAWPGQSQTARAQLGIQCLRAIGTDTALMLISGIASKVKFKALKTVARYAMEGIAQERQLSQAQLEDRIVPDCGLDEKGRRTFDFGPRQFQVLLTPEMKAVVRDSAGKTKDNLPKPNSKDDPEKAKAALAEWKLIKKQIQDTAKIQAVRLEQAMVTGRRWTLAEFAACFVQHPLMVNLARLFVWGAYVDQTLTTTFRITEDQSYADAADNPLTLDPHLQIALIHPLHLSANLRAQWGQVWGDYELVPPFPQLGRDTHGLEPNEIDAQGFTRFDKLKVPAATLVGTLEKQGWVRSGAGDGGVFYGHAKYFPAANVTALVQYTGVPMQMVANWEDQIIELCIFRAGNCPPQDYLSTINGLPLAQVDPIVISEVLRDLLMITSRAR